MVRSHCSRILFILMLVACIVPPLSGQEKGVVIVNVAVLGDSLSMEEVKSIYQGSKTFWSGSFKIRPSIANIKSPLGKRFIKQVLKMGSREYNQLWLRKTFSGSLPPPQSFKSTEQTIGFVSQNDGAIGIIPESALEQLDGTNCKVLYIDGRKTF